MAEEKVKITNQDVVDWVLECVKEAKDARLDHDLQTEEAWQQYFNKHDFSRKADWQTKVSLPMWAMGVDQAKNALKNSLKQATKLFTIEVMNPKDQLQVALANFTNDLYHEVLRRADLTGKLGDGALVGMISNIQAHKCLVKEDRLTTYRPVFREISTGKTGPDGSVLTERVLDRDKVDRDTVNLDFPVINPKNLYLDPYNRNLYRGQRGLSDVALLGSEDAKNFYRAKAIANAFAVGSAPNTEEDDAEKQDMGIVGDRNGFRRQVEKIEYWGPIYTRQGRKALGPRWVTIFNQKDLAALELYPYWHGEDPYAIANPIRVPFTPFGKHLIRHVGPLGRAITETLCMILDAQKFGTMSAFAIDTGLLEDVNEIAEGLFPGITVSTMGPNAIQQMKFTGADQTAMLVFSELLKSHQNGSGFTEFLMGQSSVRGRATAREVTEKGQQSAAFFEGMAGDIEEFGLGPMLRKGWYNMIQFFDNWDDPILRGILEKHGLTPDMLGDSPVRRYELLHGAFKFHPVGLSAAIRRADMMEKLLRLLEVLKGSPEMLAQVNGPKLFEKIMEAFEFEDLILQGNAMPPVVAPGAVSPPGSQPASGLPGMVVPPASGQTLGQLLQRG